MNEEVKITAAIVLYKENIPTLRLAVNSFLKTPLKKKLYLIDNSPTNTLQNQFKHPDIEYIFVGENIGFGSAHNLVLEKLKAPFHLILNPDIVFKSEVISRLIKELEVYEEVAFITPKVVYPNKNIQYICRKNPTFFDLINRRLKIYPKQIFTNEYRDKDLSKPFYPEFIHGCFMLFKTADFINLKGFDERYFLYMEDADICREIDKIGKKKRYFPAIEITHQHQKGSAKNIKLFIYHLTSAIKYFLKWSFSTKTSS